MENITIGNIATTLGIVVSIIGGIEFLALRMRKFIQKENEPIKKELQEQHKETLTKIADLEKIVDNNDIDVVRNRIVAFENLCRLDIENNSIKKYQYDTAYKDIDKWAEYHIKYSSLNGEINMAIENINEHYKNAKF